MEERLERWEFSKEISQALTDSKLHWDVLKYFSPADFKIAQINLSERTIEKLYRCIAQESGLTFSGVFGTEEEEIDFLSSTMSYALDDSDAMDTTVEKLSPRFNKISLNKTRHSETVNPKDVSDTPMELKEPPKKKKKKHKKKKSAPEPEVSDDYNQETINKTVQSELIEQIHKKK